jgi:hypothetical protein
MEDLTKLELPEIKILCKQHGISIVGDEKSLIKKLKYFLDPVVGTLNNHTGRKLNKNQKIVGCKIEEKEKINEILKQKGQFLYYSIDYNYYLVTE